MGTNNSSSFSEVIAHESSCRLLLTYSARGQGSYHLHFEFLLKPTAYSYLLFKCTCK